MKLPYSKSTNPLTLGSGGSPLWQHHPLAHSRVSSLRYKTPLFFPSRIKDLPAPCAYCIGRQLFSPCPFLSSTFAQLAVGSRVPVVPSSTSFTASGNLQLLACCLAPPAALKAVLPFFDQNFELFYLSFVPPVTFSKVCILIKYLKN